ncbi:hypothetical protein NDA17_006102 [Ustilago hordei]|nr:hypothetical protein NDA17_006102 [Ustilago hordei]
MSVRKLTPERPFQLIDISTNMVAIIQQVLSLFTVLAIFSVAVHAAPPDFEEQMHYEAEINQLRRHEAQDKPFEITARNFRAYVPDFVPKALRLAEGGSYEVGHYIPRSGLRGLFKTVPAKKEVFFYSLIHPDDSLGREMHLESGNLATVHWKHDRTHGVHVLSMDKIKRQPLYWDLEPLREILSRHW